MRANSTVQVEADSTGQARAIFSASQNQPRIVRQVSITTSSSRQTTATIYQGGHLASSQTDPPTGAVEVCSTRSGNTATASSDPPVILQSSELLCVVWTGASTGAICTAHFIYDVG